MKALVVAMLLAACACSSTTTPVATISSPDAASTASVGRITYIGPTPGAIGRYAVMQRGPGGIDLVDVARPHVVAGTGFNPPTFEPNPFVSVTSISESRVYFLTDGGQVGFLTPDGASGVATRIALAANQQAGFSVSPDDRRIAVSILTYNSPAAYSGMKLYVEDLAGGGNHVEIFTSTTAVEFPIGWIGVSLILAVNNPVCCPNTPTNRYSATSYHVVDPTNGHRLAALCGPTSPMGPPQPVGVMCRGAASPPQYLRWDGTAFPAPAAVPDPGDYGLALSPDGTKVLVGGTPIRVLSGAADFQFGISGWALDWLDGVHVLVRSQSDGSLWLMDPRDGTGSQLSGEAGYVGRLPIAIT